MRGTGPIGSRQPAPCGGMVRDGFSSARPTARVPVRACMMQLRYNREMRLASTIGLFGCAGLGLFWVGIAACGSNKTASPPTDGGRADSTTDDGEAAADGGAADGGVADGVADASDALADNDGPMESEAGHCTGVICAGVCLPATDCRGCSGAPLFCGATGTCVGTCAGCQDAREAGLPIACFACDSNHQNPVGTCQPADAGSYCLSGDYLGQYEGGQGYQCDCSDVSECPGPNQVCVPLGNRDAGFCLTCGEATIGPIQGQPCKDGGACEQSLAACQ